jgi:glycosyltransferase, family 2
MTNNNDMYNPLVSVIVITYNSAKYVLETLESIRVQSYQNIELIISDDCSKDNTIDICRNWIGKNEKRFVRTILIETLSNTGIPANCNRGCKEAQGEYLKLIAGDDILLPDCVSDLLNNIGDNYILTGISSSFYIGKANEKIMSESYPDKVQFSFFVDSAQKQHRRLLTNSFNFTPGVFLRKKIFDRVGYYDESYPYIEDLPFWLKCTSHNIKITFLEKPVVLYRTQHDSAVFRSSTIYNEAFYNCLFRFRKEKIYPQVRWYHFCFWEDELVKRFCYWFIVHVCKNKKNILTVNLLKLFSYFSFSNYLHKIKSFCSL